MKKTIFTLAIIMVSGLLAFAQNSGKGFSYQAIARDINGQVLQNETVTLRFSLIRQNETEPTWQEKQATITDEFGAFSLTIGQGVRVTGLVDEYSEVNFAGLPFWLKVELEADEDYYEISFRKLISVPYAEVAHNAIPNPVGTILPFAGPASAVPDGYLLCNGTSLNKNTYPALYAVIGIAWGGNTTSFKLPDCRGMFLRGVDNGSGNDPDRNSRVASGTGGLTGDNVGSKQLDGFKNHIHDRGTYKSTDYFHLDNIQGWDDTSTPEDPAKIVSIASRNITGNSGSTGGNETRPINVYVNYIIKY